MLGVTITNDFTVTVHVTKLTTKCAQTQYALRVLRAHGLNVFRSVVVAKLVYAASAWHGLTRLTGDELMPCYTVPVAKVTVRRISQPLKNFV